MRIYKTISSNPCEPKITLLLNILNLSFDYSSLTDIDSLYIPLKYFTNRKYDKILTLLSKKFDQKHH